MARPIDISFLITVYKDSEYLLPLLKTINNLKFCFDNEVPNCEVIVGFDGTYEQEKGKCKKALNYKFDSHFISDYGYITKLPNAGVQRLRNNLFKQSKGRYVIFCDVDLEFTPWSIALMYHALEKRSDKIGFAYGDFDYIGKIVKQKIFRPYDFKALQNNNFASTVSLIRRECFVGFDESIKRLQDWDMWLTMGEKEIGGIYIPFKMFDAWIKDDGISNDNNPNTINHREAYNIVRIKHGLTPV